MSKWVRLLLIVAAIATGLVMVSACGGKTKNKDDNNQPTAAATTDSGEQPTAAGDGSGDPATDLEALAGRFATQDVKVSYDYSSGSGDTASTGSMTIYWKPPDHSRVDFSSGDSGDVTFISQGDKSYICSADGAGSGTCIESPGGSSLPLPFLSFLTDPQGLSGLIDANVLGVNIDTSSETIAGQDGECFSGSSDAAGGASFEYCFNSDGILLRLSTGSGTGADFTLEATTVEGTVADADLALPYPITDIGGLTP